MLSSSLERARSMMHEIYLVVIAWTLWKVLTSFGPTHALTHPRTYAILLGIGELAVIQVSGSGS